MPVTTVHPTVDALLPQWRKVRDCWAGAEAVKARGTDYLPMLSWKRNADKRYSDYKCRADFENAVRRTLDGLVGLVTGTPPEVTVPDEFEPRLADITLTGVPFDEFAKSVLTHAIMPGRCGILADVAADEPGIGGSPEPYLAVYQAEDVINWRWERREGASVLIRVVLREEVAEPDPKDPFAEVSVEQYRVVELVDGVLTHQLWRQDRNQSQWFPYGDVVVPRRGNDPLDFVPFKFVNSDSTLPDPGAPPLLDLAEMNLSLYRTSADLEHGRHFTALPQPWIFGADVKGDVEIGSGVAWTSTNPDTRCGFLEFTGQGLGALEKAVEQKREQMVALGARLLERQKRAAETAEALRIRQAGEQSVLAGVAQTVGRALTEALRWCVWWQDRVVALDDLDDERVYVRFATDWDATTLTPQDALALAQTWQLGGMSRRTYVWNLEEGHLLPPDTTVDEEIALIEMESAQRGMGLGGETAQPDEDDEDE
jgi:hypothetical protein